MLKLLLFLLVTPLIIGLAYGASNDYGEVQAWLNGQEAPVKNSTLKVGEVIEVKLQITVKKDTYVSLALSSPGFRDSPKQPYMNIEGPSPFDKTLDVNEAKKAGERLDFKWKLKVTDAWVGGTAPINLGIGFSDAQTARSFPLSMSLANIYIEPAGGAQPASAASTPRQPGFDAVVSFLSFVLLALIGRRRPA